MSNLKKEEIVKKTPSFLKFFRQNPKRQDKVYEQIKNNAKCDFDFYVLTIFAGIIITLGILINSTAVVIGGMLIAPLVWPIMAMSVGIAMGRPALLQKSLFALLKSILIIIVVAIAFGFIVPELVLENNELLERTSPTIMELLVGLAAGFIGAFIIAYPKLGSAIAGVVVAAAIVPPVSIVGISLARGDLNSATGSFLLFLSNLIAILFSAVILFLISNFSTRSQRAEEARVSGFRWTMVLLLIIVIPLFFITKQTAFEIKTYKVTKDVVESILENSFVSDIKTQKKNEILTIWLTMHYKENISATQIQALESIISKRLNETIILKIQVIPILDAGKVVSDILIDVNEKIKKEDDISSLFIECPVIVNGLPIQRFYPKSIGCPACLKIILCEDGREYPAEFFNQQTDYCEKIIYQENSPCGILDKTISSTLEIVEPSNNLN